MDHEASLTPARGSYDKITEAPRSKVIGNRMQHVTPIEQSRPRGWLRTLFRHDSVFLLVLCGLVGVGIGIAVSDGGASDTTISWIKLPGDLFIRALKCFVLPLVFCNIVLAMVDMLKMGKAVSIASKTIGMYLLTTIVAATEGLFNSESTSEKASKVATDISLSKTIQDGIFKKSISSNIFSDLNKGNFVAVIVFAIVLGIAAHKIKRNAQSKLTVIDVLKELNAMFMILLEGVIACTAPAVVSLVAGALGQQKDMVKALSDIGILFATSVTAFSFHIFVFMPILYIIVVRANPVSYLKHFIPAQVLAFACASSASTLPVSIQCVKKSGQVPDTIGSFVLSLGATINMDGGAIYFPAAVVFLAISGGLEDKLNFSTYLLIVLVSTIGSAGTAPVPSASLVLIVTAFNTVFDTVGEPMAFSFIVAVDWLLDRFRTTMNVTGDAFMARIITAMTPDVEEVEREIIEGDF